MAQQVQVLLIDDLDGTELTDGETVGFGLDGANYEIDLSADHAKQLREAFAVYTDKARRATSGTKTAAPRRRTRADRESNSGIREWAKAKGYQISERGRIPTQVLQEYSAEFAQ